MKNLISRVICALLVLAWIGTCLGAVEIAEGTVRARDKNAVRVSQSLRAIAVQAAEAVPPPPSIDSRDAELIAKTLYGECRSCASVEQAAVAWCILNRADTYHMSVEQVVTAPSQFMGYSARNPVPEDLYAIAADVLERHAREAIGETDVGRVLPEDYLWFYGDGRHNHFRNRYVGGSTWNWSLPNPYSA